MDKQDAPRTSRRNAAPRTGREILGRIIGRTLLSLIVAVIVLYAADWLFLRFKIATHRQAFGTVTVQPYYAVPRKDHKTEFLFDDPQSETCVNSLFPHNGDSPCWYLSRNKEKRIDM